MTSLHFLKTRIREFQDRLPSNTKDEYLNEVNYHKRIGSFLYHNLIERAERIIKKIR